ARSMTRQKEMAIRSALGAGRGRVIRQLLTESIVLAIFGGLLGLALAVWGTRGLVQLVPEDIPRMSQIGIDNHVFGFTLLAAILTGILFGLFPALHGSKTNLVDSLKESGRGLSGSLQHNRLRGSLVMTEMALAMALLMGAGLMIQSFARLQNVNPGFNPHNVLTFNLDLPDSRYSTPQQKTFYKQLLSRLKTLPGVSSAAASWTLPFSGNNASITFSIEGRPLAKGNEPNAAVRIISPAYFRTMQIPMIEGRDFAPTDTATAPGVVIVNQEFAHLFFPNEDPIGKHITPGVSDVGKEMVRQIIGVAANVKARTLKETPKPEYYLPYQQCLIGGLSIVMRTRTAPEGLVGPARNTVHSMDSNLPLYGLQTMDDFVGASVAQPRFSMLLLSIFAGLALALTALGLYGVISYSVAQRTHEIGIRMALGAQTGDVLKLVIRQAMLLTVMGWVAGVACGFVLARFLSSQLYGIGTADPFTLLAVTVLLGGIAFLASYIPARRAMRVDPMVALRYE
ncbi:MAG: ABC transporter permease, partial [Candidatus Acidiferrales bacterium]